MNLEEIKKLAYIISQKPDPTGNEFLDEKWERPEYQQPYYRFFYRLAEMYKPEVVVELGGWQGLAAAHFAAGNPDGTVITIDHHTDPGDNTNRGRMINCCREFGNMVYIQGWSVDAVAQEQTGSHALGDAPSAFPKVMELLEGRKIDILFVDSWHVEKYCWLDWEAYNPLVKPGGLVIIDDCIDGTSGTAIDGVRRFFDKLPGKKCLLDGVHTGYPMGCLMKEEG